MTTMRFVEVENIHGQTYNLVVRKHSTEEIIHGIGYPYSIRISNANPEAFDLNTHVFGYEDWQTAYKRLKHWTEVYKTIELSIMWDVDGRTGLSRN